jgi:hypothetical protein
MPDGNELGDPDLILGQDRLQGVVPAVFLRPVPERVAADPVARRLPSCFPLAAGGRQVMQRAGRGSAIRRHPQYLPGREDFHRPAADELIRGV